MENDNIIQLRNHHLQKGRKNDRTPIYPITDSKAVRYKDPDNPDIKTIHDAIKESNGVTRVEGLPELGQSGKIYYNEADSSYYIYNTSEGQFVPLAAAGDMPRVILADTVEDRKYGEDQWFTDETISIPIEPNKYYDFSVRPLNDSYIQGLGVLPIKLDPNMAYQYCGRFVVSKDLVGKFSFRLVNKRIILGDDREGIPDSPADDGLGNTDVHLFIPDGKVPTFEAGHYYEFTIIYNCCIIMDITPPAQSGYPSVSGGNDGPGTSPISGGGK